MDPKEKLLEGRKLIDALYELSKENFSLSDDTILDKLYVHIEKKADESDFVELLRDIGVWLESVLKQWNSNTLCCGVKVFSIRMMGLIGSKPHGFTTIKHMLPDIEKLISSSEVQNDSSLMVPLMNDLTLFLNHEGLDWVLNTEVWKHAVKTFYEDRSIYINRSGVKFISLLLSKVGNNNKHKGVEILNFVCKPLVDNSLLTVKPLSDVERHYISPLKKDSDTKRAISIKKSLVIKHLARSAKYLCDILDELFLSDSNLPVKFICNITTDLNSDNCPSPQDYQIFLQLLVMLELSNACWATPAGEGDCAGCGGSTGCVAPCPMEPLYLVVHQAVRSLMSLGHFNSLLDLCVFCLNRVHRFRVSVPHIHNFSECTKCRELESMLVYQLKMFLELHSTCFCTDPCLIGGFCTVEGSEEPVSGDHLNDDCLKRFDDIRKSETLSFQYFQLGVFATARSLNFIFYTISRKAISSVVINSFDTMMKHFWSGKASMSSSLLNLITLASKLAENYIEQCISKQLFSTVTWILEKEKEDPRITINTLQLLNKILKTQVMPDLIIWPPAKASYFDYLKLKMPSIAISMMKNLKNRSSWEIRDTTLEVYQLVIEVGDLIPGLFSMIFDENLYSQVLELAAKDAMAYVRSSAFKFFSKAVRAKLFLDKLSSKDLSDLAVKTLLDDEMPEPRMAACDLLAAMYVTDFLTDHGMPEKLYKAVFVASMKELDWEVKKATLRFWQCTIIKQLANEGVPMDPKFLRSSDATTKEDVVLKIISIMETLSDIGCFKVIWSDVIDDSDISVSQEASHVINNILHLDRKWKFVDRLVNNNGMEVVEENLTNKKLSTKDFFMNIRQNFWSEKLAARKKWIENTCDDLPSLLDHILNPENQSDWDRNAIDCY